MNTLDFWFSGDIHVICFETQTLINPFTTAIGRPFFGHKSPAARARELFKPSTDLASLLLKIEKNNFRFWWEVF